MQLVQRGCEVETCVVGFLPAELGGQHFDWDVVIGAEEPIRRFEQFEC